MGYAGFTTVLTGERSKCRPIEFIIPTEKTQCQLHLTSEHVRGDMPQCSHTKESRVKNHDVLTEKVFLWHTEHSEEKMEVASIFQILLLREDDLLASRAGLAVFPVQGI